MGTSAIAVPQAPAGNGAEVVQGGHVATEAEPPTPSDASPAQSQAVAAQENSGNLGLEPSGPQPVAEVSSAMPVSAAVVIELFAGSANLSKAFRSIGMQVIAIDTNDVPQIKIVKLNLLHKNSVDLVLRLLETRKVLFVHMAPPCSTSSQARMIQRSWSDPKPLRSWQFADGLPGLSFLDRARVSQANKLYHVCSDVAQACQRLGIWWSIENPTSSLMWLTSPLQQLWTCLRDHIKFAHSTIVFTEVTAGKAQLSGPHAVHFRV